MAKIDMVCPFSHRLCDECPLYRGRHYYLCFCKKYRGYIGQPKEDNKSGVAQHSVDFSGFGEAGGAMGGSPHGSRAQS